MLQKIVSRVLRKRHFWRDVGFDELSEIYTNSFLRSLANSLVGIFVPIYLYKLGYGLTAVLGFLAIWFLFRPIYDYINAFFVARFGPKHGLAIAACGHIFYLVLLLTLPTMHWPLWIVAQVGSISMSLHLISFNTDFSKVKHSRHGGKEISYVVNIEKIGGVVGPLAGGLIANYFDPRYTIGLAVVLQILAVIPLFMTKEAVRIRQHITFRGLPWRLHKRDYISCVPFSIENSASLIFWPLFLAIIVLTTNTYAKIGVIIAASTAFSIIVTRLIGNMIDNSKGRLLLRFGTILNATVHLFRPVVDTFAGAFIISLINDPITAAYRMPYMKGLYDASDSVPGYRIAYLSSIIIVESISKFLLCSIAWLLSFALSGETIFLLIFILVGISSLGIMLERFPSLNQRYTTK